LEFQLVAFIGGLRFEELAPAPGGAEMVDEDAPQTSLAHDASPAPHGRCDAVERGKDPVGRPAVVGEQEADLICSYR
jgi:hypothetical protein